MRKNYFFPVYILIILAITCIAGLRPDYNWDMLPYMAILEKMDGAQSFNTVHSDIYASAEKNLPRKKYKDLVNPNDAYRNKMATDAAAFKTQLPFFNIKPVYLLTAFLFYKIGVSITYATVLPSLVSFFFINLIAFFWCRKFNLSFAALCSILFLICVITVPLAVRSNPDTLSCLFLLIASYFFLESENLLLTILFLMLSILVRPDNIIFCFLLYAIVLAGKWKKKIPVYVSAVYILLLAVTYYLPVKIMSNPGWGTLFYHAFIDNTANPSAKQTITIPVYFKVIRENVLNIKGIACFIFLLILSAWLLLPVNFKPGKISLYKLFYAAVLLWTISKTLIFPMVGLRFVIPPFLLMLFTVVKEYESGFLFKKRSSARIKSINA